MQKPNRREVLMMVMCGLIFATSSASLYFGAKYNEALKTITSVNDELTEAKEDKFNLQTNADNDMQVYNRVRADLKKQTDLNGKLQKALDEEQYVSKLNEKNLNDANAAHKTQLEKLNGDVLSLTSNLAASNRWIDTIRTSLECETDEELKTKLASAFPKLNIASISLEAPINATEVVMRTPKKGDEDQGVDNNQNEPDRGNAAQVADPNAVSIAIKAEQEKNAKEVERLETRFSEEIAKLADRIRKRDLLLKEQTALIDRLKANPSSIKETTARTESQTPQTNLGGISKQPTEAQPTSSAKPVASSTKVPAKAPAKFKNDSFSSANRPASTASGLPTGSSSTPSFGNVVPAKVPSSVTKSDGPVIQVIETLDGDRVIRREVYRGGVRTNSSVIPK